MCLVVAGAYNKYNDSEWHVVIAARDHSELRLDIDDYEAYQLVCAEAALLVLLSVERCALLHARLMYCVP